MKILFLVYHGFSDVSGISKKIHYQVKGLEQNGHDVHLCYYDRGTNGHWQRLVSHNGQVAVLTDFGSGKLAGLRQRTSYGSVASYCARQSIQMVYARCFQNANPFLIRFFRKLKSMGVKSVMEIPTYPYDQEFQGFSRTERLQLHIDQQYRDRLARQLQAIVTFTNEQLIFGQRTINISNGVDLDSIPLHQKVDTSQELHLIGVAEVHFWHGYDRLIAGLGEYYRKGHTPKQVYFHIVGGVWKSEMYDDEHAPGFHELIEKYGLQDKVIFHGQLFGEALNSVFRQSSFAVGSLARHRSGISDIKTLKNREYATRGLPFIYSENDSDFDHQPYVLKAPADESPVDIAQIVAFEEQLTMKPQEIRHTVEHLSWKMQMQKVVESL
ncbi:MAG: glycosyltransferase family 1 protein [Prevotella sp.]|nr:glycosyltransferase family 1 protein [Prevotella sp.]